MEIIFKVIVCFTVVMISSYIISFIGLELSASPSDWGAFGDFFGGFLNPIVALGAFLLLYRSVRIQQEELTKTSDALVEASNAQKSQLRATQLSARIQSLQLQLEKVNIALAAAYEHRNAIITKGTINARFTDVLTEEGKLVSSKVEIQRAAEWIADLDNKAQGLIDKISGVNDEFKSIDN